MTETISSSILPIQCVPMVECLRSLKHLVEGWMHKSTLSQREREKERKREREKERKREREKEREREKGEVVGSRRLVIRKKKIRLETKVLAINLFLSFIVG